MQESKRRKTNYKIIQMEPLRRTAETTPKAKREEEPADALHETNRSDESCRPTAGNEESALPEKCLFSGARMSLIIEPGGGGAARWVAILIGQRCRSVCSGEVRRGSRRAE